MDILNYTVYAIDIKTLDTQLHNLPKKLYISMLLDMCSKDENLVSWYRNALRSRAKDQPDCPLEKLLRKKTSSGGPSISTCKYAKDCSILYMFLQGEKSCINDNFGKIENNPIVTEINKAKAVVLKTTIQLLVERIANVENIQNSKDKTISSLSSDLHSPQLQFKHLRSDHERVHAESKA